MENTSDRCKVDMMVTTMSDMARLLYIHEVLFASVSSLDSSLSVSCTIDTTAH